MCKSPLSPDIVYMSLGGTWRSRSIIAIATIPVRTGGRAQRSQMKLLTDEACGCGDRRHVVVHGGIDVIILVNGPAINTQQRQHPPTPQLTTRKTPLSTPHHPAINTPPLRVCLRVCLCVCDLLPLSVNWYRLFL